MKLTRYYIWLYVHHMLINTGGLWDITKKSQATWKLQGNKLSGKHWGFLEVEKSWGVAVAPFFFVFNVSVYILCIHKWHYFLYDLSYSNTCLGRDIYTLPGSALEDECVFIVTIISDVFFFFRSGTLSRVANTDTHGNLKQTRSNSALKNTKNQKT